MVVGLFSAFIMPLVGSIIDHTDYRRQVGCISAAALSIFILVQMLIMEQFWFIAAILQVFIAFSYTVHLCAVYAYLPELTSDPDTMVQYTAQFSAAQYGGSVGFLIVMIVILSMINRNGLFGTTTISQSVVFVVCSVFFGYAWTNLFSPRPARHRIPVGQSLVSAGFWKIYKTGRTILQHHSAIKWMLVSVSFTEAATTTFTTVAITYMTLFLQFTPRQNGIAILLLLLFGLPGTRLAAWSTARFNPQRSLQACLVLWIVTTAAASLLLKQPNQEVLAYIFAMIWGIGIGWIYPSEKTLYVTIIPRGQEAELMGVYICACQILSWLPPLVFSIMTELGLSMRIALLGLTIYFLIGLLVSFLVGDYEEAVRHGKQIDEVQLRGAKSMDGDITSDNATSYQQWMEKDHNQTAINQMVSRADVEKNELPLQLINR
jgi:UMF1 family MFS transporter